MIKYTNNTTANENDPYDFSNSLNILGTDDWKFATPEQRVELVDRGMNAYLSAFEKDKSKTIQFHNAKGDLAEAATYNPAGITTRQFEDNQKSVRNMLIAAARDPDGGLYTDEETGEQRAAAWTGRMLTEKREKEIDELPDFSLWREDRNTIVEEGNEEAGTVGTWEGYVAFANFDTKTNEAMIDVGDKRLKKEWQRRNEIALYNPDKMGDLLIDEVGGQIVLNPNKIDRINDIEAEIANSNKSEYEKKLILMDFRKKVDGTVAKLVNDMSAVDATNQFGKSVGGKIANVMTIGIAGSLAGAFSSPLQDELMKEMVKSDFSGYEWMKKNQDRFDKDQNGIGQEIVDKFRDALIGTGTGALVLAGKIAGADEDSFIYKPAEAWGALAEATAAGYNNGVAFSVGGIDIHRRDLTELTGQVGSFIAMGGLGSGSRAVLSRFTPMMTAKQLVATNLAKAAALQGVSKSMSTKVFGQVMAVFTDPTAYAGGIQAAGMGFGRTFDQHMRETGNRDEAFKAASIDGLSDGLSALIATGVMNRFGMGAEAAFGGNAAREGAEGIVQNVRSRMTAAATMKGVKETLGNLVENPELRKQITKDLLAKMNASAKEKGLRGWGIIGGTASEAVEESMDEAMSDVFKVMLDDSKTWNEEQWGNIGTKWKDYVKAGILGAIGGAGGEAESTALSGTNPFSKSKGLVELNAKWDMIKSNVKTFDHLDNVIPNLKGAGDAKSVAEYIAWEGPEKMKPQDLIKMKSAALIHKALENNTASMNAARVKDPVPASKDSPTSGDPLSVAPSDTRYSEDEAGGVMEVLGVPVPDGQDLKEDVVLEDETDSEIRYKQNGKKVVIMPMKISDGNRGLYTGVAARVETIGEDGKKVSKVVTGKEAHEMLAAATPDKRSALAVANIRKESPKSAISRGLLAFADSESKINNLKEGQASMVLPPKAAKEAAATTPSEAPKAKKATDFKKGEQLSYTDSKGNASEVTFENVDPSVENTVFVKMPNGDSRLVTVSSLSPISSPESAAAPKAGASKVSPAKEQSNENKTETQAETERELLAKTAAGAQSKAAATSSPDPSTDSPSVAPSTEPKSLPAEPTAEAGEQLQTNETEQGTGNPVNPTAITAEGEQDNADGTEGESRGSSGSVSINGEADTVSSETPDPTSEVEAEIQDFFSRTKEVSFGEQPKGSKPNKSGIYVSIDSNGDPRVMISKSAYDNATAEQIKETVDSLLEDTPDSQAALATKKEETDPELSEEVINNLNEESSYVVNRSAIDGKKVAPEGKWQKAEGRDLANRAKGGTFYILTPPKGESLKISVGDIITISGNKPGVDEANRSVLILVDNLDGKYHFKEVLYSDLTENQNLEDRGSASTYFKSKLWEASTLFKTHLNQIQGQGSVLSPAAMETLFNRVMAVISPTTKFKVVSRKMTDEEVKDDKFIQANSDGEGSIEVDFERLAAQFNEQYKHSNAKSEFGKSQLSLDAAGKMAKTIDEEIIHILVYRLFKRKDINKFMGSIAEEMRKGIDHPYANLVRETIAERVISPGKAPKEAHQLNREEIYTVGAELLRKLHQLATSGSTTELHSEHSRYLQYAIAGDERANVGKDHKNYTFLRTIGEMVRRYANRIRKILWAKWQQGRISEDQRNVLMQLNKLYKSEGIQGDIDFAYQDALTDAKHKQDLYQRGFEDTVQGMARKHVFAGSRLREFQKRYRIANVLVVDPEEMTLGINKVMWEKIEKSGMVNMKDLQTFLDDMNAKADYGMANSSYQQAMTSAFLKKQKMDMLRDQLEADFDDNDLQLGLVDKGTKGFLSDANLWTEIIDAAPDGVTSQEMLDTFSRAKLEQVEILQGMEAASNQAKGLFLMQAMSELQALEGKTGVTSVKSLADWMRTLRMTDQPISEIFEGYEEAATAEDKAAFLETHRRDSIAKLILLSDSLGDEISSLPESDLELSPFERVYGPVDFLAEMDKAVVSKRESDFLAARFKSAIKGESGKLLTEFRELKYRETKARRELARNNRMIQSAINSHTGVESAKVGRKKLTKQQFDNFREFIESVEDYNGSVVNAVKRSMGDFGTDSEGFGINIKNLLTATQDGRGIKFRSITDQVEPFTSGKGQDLLKARLIGKHKTKLEDERSKEVTYTTPFERGAFSEIDYTTAPLTPAQVERNAFINAFRTEVESTNRATARIMYQDYWIAKHTAKVWDLMAQQKYEKTAGFKFESYTDPENGMVSYEDVARAFPGLANQRYYQHTTNIKRLGGKFDEKTNNPFRDLLEQIEETRQWVTTIRSKYIDTSENVNGIKVTKGIIKEIGGNQTVANNWSVILRETLGNENAASDEYSIYGSLDNFEHQLRELYGRFFVSTGSKSLPLMARRYVNGTGGIINDFSTFTLKEGVTMKDAIKGISLELDLTNDKTSLGSLHTEMREAKKMVDLAREAARVIVGEDEKSRRWKGNVEKQGNRVMRDASHIPDNPKMLALRDFESDPRVFGKVSWDIQYMGDNPSYGFSSNWALEGLDEFNALQYNSPREAFIYTEKASEVHWLNSEQAKDYEADPANIANLIPQGSRVMTDKETGDLFYVTNWKTNFNDIIVTDNEARFNDYRNRPFLTGETSPLLADSLGNNQYNESYSKHNAGRQAVSRNITVTKWALILGSNAGDSLNIQEGQQFRVDLMLMDMGSRLSTEDVLRERERYLSFEGDEPMSEKVVSEMDSDQLQTLFRKAHVEHLIDRAIRGAFKDNSGFALSDKMTKQFRDVFLERNGGSYRYTDSERFLHDIIQFKASFESGLIEEARIKNGDMIALALQTVENQEGNSFVSPEDAAAIGALLKKNFTAGEIKEQKDGDAKAKRTSKFLIYDADRKAGIDSGDPVVSKILSLLTGKTLFVTPSDSDVSRGALNGIGLRVFEGTGGNPHVVYMPTMGNSDKEIRGRDAASALTMVFSIMAKGNPAVVEQINGLAETFNRSTDPVMRTQSIIDKYFPDFDRVTRIDPELTAFASVFSDPTSNPSAARDALFAFSTDSAEDKARLEAALTEHFMAVNQMARDLGINDRTRASLSVFPELDREFVSNMMLVSQLLTDPKMKEFFDESFIGNVTVRDTKLSEGLELELMDHIRGIAAVDRRIGTKRVKYKEGDLSKKTEMEMAMERAKPEEERQSDRDESSQEKTLEDIDDRISPSLSTAKGVNNLLRELALKRGDVEAATRFSLDDDYNSDYVLFGMLASIFESQIQAKLDFAEAQGTGVTPFESGDETVGLDQFEIDPIPQDRPGLDYLRGKEDHNLTSTANGGIYPMIGKKYRDLSKQYVGEWRNLMQARKDGSTWLNIAFRGTRVDNINASLLNQTEWVKTLVEGKAKEVVDEAVRNWVASNEEGIKVGFAGGGRYFKVTDVDVPLNEDLLGQLRKLLPGTELDDAIAAEKEGYQALQNDQKKLSSLLTSAEKTLFRSRGDARASLEKLIARLPQTDDVLSAISSNISSIFSNHRKILSNKTILKGDAARFFSGQIKNAFAPDSHGNNSVKRIGFNLSQIGHLLDFRDSVESSSEDTSVPSPFQDVEVSQINEMIEGSIRAYDHHVDVVNGEIDRAMEGASRLSGIGFTATFKASKIHLRKANGLTAENITRENLTKLNDAKGSFSQERGIESNLSKLINSLVGASFGEQIAQSFSITGKAGNRLKRADTSRFFSEMMRRVDAGSNPLETIKDMLEEGINSESAPVALFMKDLVGHLAMNSIEASELLESGAKSAKTIEFENKLEITVNKLKADLARIDRELTALDNGDDTRSNTIGRTYFVGDLPFVSKEGDVFPVRRQVGVKLRLVPDGEMVTPAKRRKFVQDRNAVLRAIGRFTDNHVEDAYNAIKNQGDNFGSFDMSKMIGEAVESTRLDAQLVAEQFGLAVDEATKARNRGMTARNMALLTDPASKEFDALTKGEKDTVKMLRLPANAVERAQELGRYMRVGGESIVLMPTNAKEQLMLLHPKTVTRRNANSQVKDITLAAISLDRASESVSEPDNNESKSFFLDYVKENKSGAFDSKALFGLTKDIEGNLTREQAAEIFSGEYTRRIEKALKTILNQNNLGKEKSHDFSKGNAARSLYGFQFEIKQLVQALDHPVIARNKDAKDKIVGLLRKIDQIDDDSFSMIKDDPWKRVLENIHKLDIKGVLADTFSAIEAEMISKQLSLGLTVSSGDKDLWMMKYIYHSDARTRNDFRNSFISRQTSRHLQTFFEHGIDSKSGRHGSKTAEKLAKKKIGEAAKAISGPFSVTDNLNHTIGYVISMLDGLSNSNGQSLEMAFNQWLKAMKTGFVQNEELHKKQEQMRGNTVSKYWNDDQLDLSRDYELAQEIRKIMEDSGVDKIPLAPGDGQTTDEFVLGVIESLKNALRARVEDGKQVEVENYANVLTEIFKDIDSAMHLTVAMTSTEIKDSTRQTISSTPIRLSFAANPASKRQDRGGKYVADPLDTVRILDSSFFGGNVTSDHSFQTRDVFRPIEINGISAPMSLIQDSIYRLNVTPTYGIMRGMIGKVTLANNVPTVETEDSGILKYLESQTPEDQRDRKSRLARKIHYGIMANTRVALASIAREYETGIHNDFQHGVVNTGGAEVMRVLGSFYAVRALASPMQLWDQTSGPSVGYSMGKLATGNAKSAALYWKLLGKMLFSPEYKQKVRAFIEEHAPYVYYRAADGMDVAADQQRGQKRFGRDKVKRNLGKGIRKLESTGEYVLDLTIGSGERILASSVFLVELAQLMNTSDVDSILAMNEIPSAYNSGAQLKVNDFMGQSDATKKGWLFQTRDQNPVTNAFIRSLVRFSSMTASMSPNVAINIRILFSKKPAQVTDEDWKNNREEAIENVVTTMTQDLLFPIFKLKALIPVLSYLFFLAAGDDDDEAARKAQTLANKALAVDDDSNPIAAMAKTLLAGRKREFFKLDGDMDGAQSSALAEILTKSSGTVASTFWPIGGLFGYSPVQGLLNSIIAEDLSKSIATTITGAKAEDTYVRSYKPGWLESAAGTMAPAAVTYDYLSALKLGLWDYTQTSDFKGNKPKGLLEIAFYLISEAIPFMREARGQLASELEEEVKKLPKNRK